MELTVDGLSAGYQGSVPVLEDVNVAVGAGEITGLIGPNGSGKSTLLKAIGGYVSIFRGCIRLGDRETTGWAPHRIARAGVCYVAQEQVAFPLFSVEENLDLAGRVTSDPRTARARLQEAFDVFPVLRERRTDRADRLSGGQRRQLEFARAIMMRPKLVLLDEPSAGVDPKTGRQLYDAIARMSSAGHAVLLADQNVEAALTISSTVTELRSGRVGKTFIPEPTDVRAVVRDWLA